MRFLAIISLLFLNNCSFNSDSQYWTENNLKNIEMEQKLHEILKKTNDITNMSFSEYEIYIDDYTKKSNYPIIGE